MGIQQYTYWSVTINNPDENDLVLVRNPNDRYVRQFIYTLEEGAEGTPHVQGWCRLHRNQTCKFMQRLYPRAHFKAITKDEYNENCHDYAQKNDQTTRGKHVISTTEALQTIETIMVKVIHKMMDDYEDVVELEDARRYVQRDMVKEDYRYAKFFVSAVYKSMWREYGHEMYENIVHSRQEQYARNDIARLREVSTTETNSHCDQESEASEVEGSDQSSSSETDEDYDQ